MKFTKAQIKAFEDEDREIIAQTEADFEAGNLLPVRHAPGEKAAIMAAAGEALKWSHSLQGKSRSAHVTVHVKGSRSASGKTKAAKAGKAVASRKPAVRKIAR